MADKKSTDPRFICRINGCDLSEYKRLRTQLDLCIDEQKSKIKDIVAENRKFFQTSFKTTLMCEDLFSVPDVTPLLHALHQIVHEQVLESVKAPTLALCEFVKYARACDLLSFLTQFNEEGKPTGVIESPIFSNLILNQLNKPLEFIYDIYSVQIPPRLSLSELFNYCTTLTIANRFIFSSCEPESEPLTPDQLKQKTKTFFLTSCSF